MVTGILEAVPDGTAVEFTERLVDLRGPVAAVRWHRGDGTRGTDRSGVAHRSSRRVNGPWRGRACSLRAGPVPGGSGNDDDPRAWARPTTVLRSVVLDRDAPSVQSLEPPSPWMPMAPPSEVFGAVGVRRRRPPDPGGLAGRHEACFTPAIRILRRRVGRPRNRWKRMRIARDDPEGALGVFGPPPGSCRRWDLRGRSGSASRRSYRVQDELSIRLGVDYVGHRPIDAGLGGGDLEGCRVEGGAAARAEQREQDGHHGPLDTWVPPAVPHRPVAGAAAVTPALSIRCATAFVMKGHAMVASLNTSAYFLPPRG